MVSVKLNPPHELLQFCNNVSRHMGKADPLDTNIFGFSRSFGQGCISSIITETPIQQYWMKRHFTDRKQTLWVTIFMMETGKQWGTSATSYIQLLHQ